MKRIPFFAVAGADDIGAFASARAAGGIVPRAKQVFRSLLFLLMVATLGMSTAYSEEQYFYDVLGRLIHVVNSNGSVIDYQYDANGNVTTINRQTLFGQGPYVDSFSPTVVNPGAVVTLLGANLNPAPGGTTIAVGAVPVTVNSITNTQAAFVAPSGSGVITVSTSHGQANSATPLTVLPLSFPIPIANIAGVAVLPQAAAPQSFSVNVLNKSQLLQFNATQGQYLSVQLSAFSTIPSGASVNYEVMSPTNAIIASGSVSALYPSIHLPMISVTGTYFVRLMPSTARYQANAQLEVNAAVVSDSAPLAVATTIPGQTTRFVFSATAGENLGLGISNLVKTNGGGYPHVNVYVFKPDGSLLTWSGGSGCQPAGCGMNMSNVPVTGVYGVLVTSPDPTSEPALTMTFTATVSRDLVVVPAVNTATTVNVSRRGQNGRVTFAGTAGGAIALQIGGLVTVPAGQYVDYTVLNPDGSTLTSAATPSGYTFNLTNLPTTGTYTLFVDPRYGATANQKVKVIPSTSAVVAVQGSSSNFNTTSLPGSYAYFSFTATAGENLGLGISNVVRTNGGGYTHVNVYVYKPDGSSLTWSGGGGCQPANGGCGMNMSNVPVTGVYGVLVTSPDPSSEPALTMTFTATVSRDLVVAPTVNTATTVNVSRRGQNGRVTFAGTAGGAVALQIGGLVTVPAGHHVDYTVLDPNGNTLTSAATPSGYTFNLTNLPTTGTYTLFVDPRYGATANQKVKVIPSTSAVVAVQGSSSNFNTTSLPGSYAYFSFTATAGENLGLGISNVVRTNGGGYTHVNVYVYKPDGSSLTWSGGGGCQTANGGCGMNMSNVPVTGVYGVLVTSPDPSSEPALTMTFTATVSRDLVVAPTVNTATTVNVSRRGQNGRVTFAGTAGGAVALQIGGLVTVPAGHHVDYTVLDPNGNTLTSAATPSGYTFNLNNLPTTGTYTLFIDPRYGATANQKVKVIPSTSAAVAVNGASSAINTTSLPGSYAYFSFTATAGENLGLGISNIVRTNGGGYTHVNVYVYKPDGSSLTWSGGGGCQPANGGCDMNMSNVPVTGVYGVLVTSPDPSSEPALTMTFTATVSRDLVVALTTGTATTVNVSRRGQNGRATFVGAAGGAVALQIGGIVTVPAGASVDYTVLNPDGTTLTSTTTSSGYTFNLTGLPATGTYTLFVDPRYGVMANQQVTRQ